MGWTDERVEALKKLWADGMSCTQIGRQLGGVSRNAVIGKVHRMGLPGRETPTAPTRAKAFRIAPPRPALKVVGRTVVEEAEPRAPREIIRVLDEAPGSATLLTLESRMCKWPIGDPASDTFTFCGRRKDDGSYCAEHARIAFQPPKGGKERAQRELTRSLRRYS